MRELPLQVPGEHPLAGTLTLPEGDDPEGDDQRPFPAVAFASGSGPLDRDSNFRRMRFDVGRQVARALAEGGLASLRYDKRGVGESPGDWRAAGLHDNADDLGRALDALAARPEIDPARLLVGGHSEGALLAAAVAARGAPVTGAVLLSCSARPGAELMRWQVRTITPTLPAPVRGLLRLLRLLRVDLEKRTALNHEKLRRTTTDVVRMAGRRINARWWREFLDHDPRDDLRRISVPVLALTGERDLQADPADLDTIAATAPGEVTVRRVPDLTHTLRRRSGRVSLAAYKREVREPVDAEVLDTVVSWCRAVTGLAAVTQ